MNLLAQLLLPVGLVLNLVIACVAWKRKAMLELSYTQMDVTTLTGSRISYMMRCCSQHGTIWSGCVQRTERWGTTASSRQG
jgi:hypothetical protein